MSLKGKKIPKWIQKSEIYQHMDDYDFDTIEKIPLYDLKIKTFKDFKNVLKTIRFWKIENPYPYEIWSYILNPKNEAKVVNFLDENSENEFNEYFIPFFRVESERDLAGLCVENGELDCLKYIDKHPDRFKDPWHPGLCMTAAADNYLDCLKFLYKIGCPWDEETTLAAASSGHLECLMYAHEHGCGWTKDVCLWSAMNGHLDCLQYAVENRCPINIEKSIAAAEDRKIEAYLKSLKPSDYLEDNQDYVENYVDSDVESDWSDDED